MPEDQENQPSSESRDDRLLVDLLNRLLDRDQSRDDLERETVKTVSELTAAVSTHLRVSSEGRIDMVGKVDQISTDHATIKGQLESVCRKVDGLTERVNKPTRVPAWVIVVIIVLVAAVLGLAGLNVSTKWIQVEQPDEPTVSSDLTLS